MDTKLGKKQAVVINVPEQMQTPVFSNVAQVNATDREVMLDFAFIQPNQKQGIVVAKIALTPEHAQKLSQVLLDVLKKHYEHSKSVK